MENRKYLFRLIATITWFLLFGGCDSFKEKKIDSDSSNPIIAFTTNRDGNDEIYVMNLNGGNQINLTNHPDNDSQPVWSPDGTKIAFTSNRDGATEIYVMNSDGSNQVNLTNNSSYDYFPRWLPNGNRILFVSYRDEILSDIGHPAPEIYIMEANGSNPTRLTSNQNDESFISWSSSENIIALAMNIKKDETSNSFTKEIYTMNLKNNELLQLTELPHQNDYPTWSPDGTKIAFVSYRSGSAEIYVMNADGSGQTQLTFNATYMLYNLHPSWSPDGLHIAFTSNIDGNYDIYIMNLDGSSRIRLTDNESMDTFPSWSPTP